MSNTYHTWHGKAHRSPKTCARLRQWLGDSIDTRLGEQLEVGVPPPRPLNRVIREGAYADLPFASRPSDRKLKGIGKVRRLRDRRKARKHREQGRTGFSVTFKASRGLPNRVKTERYARGGCAWIINRP